MSDLTEEHRDQKGGGGRGQRLEVAGSVWNVVNFGKVLTVFTLERGFRNVLWNRSGCPDRGAVGSFG